MSYDKVGFTKFYSGSANACASYRSYLNKVDGGIAGIDQFLENATSEELLSWVDDNHELLQPSPRSTKSAVKKYLEFRGLRAFADVEVEQADELAEVETTLFKLEREMQAAVRRQLPQIEAGLVEADGGVEMNVATGRIDILATDAAQRAVVIELKAGKCPAGALEQLLGYAHDWSAQSGTSVRALLIAGSFTERQRAAARQANVELKTYSYALTFNPVT